MSIQSEKYSNDLLEAITLVTENIIASKADYDQTLIYTIKDNSNIRSLTYIRVILNSIN